MIFDYTMCQFSVVTLCATFLIVTMPSVLLIPRPVPIVNLLSHIVSQGFFRFSVLPLRGYGLDYGSPKPNQTMALNISELQSATDWVSKLDKFFDLDLSDRTLWARFESTIDAIPDRVRDSVDVYCPNSVPAWTAICDASDKELSEGKDFRYIVMTH